MIPSLARTRAAVVNGACSTLLLLLLSGCSDVTETGPNLAPVATIRTPEAGASFRAGDRVAFAGGAADAEDGVIPPSGLVWWANLHHDDHTHPFLDLTAGVDSGEVMLPVRGETSANVWYRFYLVATDRSGAVDTVSRDVVPQTATLRFETEPAGLRFTLDGQPISAPFSVEGVVGMERDIGVVSPQDLGAESYAFESWAHGGAANQTIVTPATDNTYTARFTATSAANRPPTVSLTAPSDGSIVVVNSAITISADASDSDGSVGEVRFYANSEHIATDDTSPYDAQWTPAATGVHRLTSRAIDDDGAVATSDTVQVDIIPEGSGDVQPPVVQLTAPSDQTRDLTGEVTITASASDDGGVAGVQFQVDGENLGAEDTAAPYEVVLPSTSAYAYGSHVIRARARDAAGNVSAWSSARVSFGGSQSLPAGFSMAPFGSSMAGLGTALAFAPDGRLFVALKSGAIRVIRDGVLLSRNFATFSVADGGERGLIGLTFHPQFATNGWLYVHYRTLTDSVHTRISRLTASGDTAVAGSEEVLIELPASQSPFHNGGALHFGPDRKLYVALGDDAASANAQSLSTVYGKILRFNDDGTIPADNPFYRTASGLNRSIWALGLRNPFTFGFHPTTGRMFINDVGEDSWEEINEGGAGRNYGWPATEGPTTDLRFTGPVYAYPHFNGLVTGLSVVGASFYDPPVQQFPASYEGDYFFADYVGESDGAGGWIHRLDVANDSAVYAFARLPAATSITNHTVGPDGALYVLLAGSWSLASSQVHRISYSP